MRNFFWGGVAKFSGGLRNFRGDLRNFRGGFEKFSEERVESGRVKFFSVVVTFFREGLAVFWGPG